jgi:hypothetical protein
MTRSIRQSKKDRSPIPLNTMGKTMIYLLGEKNSHVGMIKLTAHSPNYAFEADAVRQRTVSCGVLAPRGSTRR